jgi:hypothetical protein
MGRERGWYREGRVEGGEGRERERGGGVKRGDR